MKTNLQSSKSILAKLLASENITVSHQNVKTAYFDLKARTMVLPVWKDMDGDLYDLLTGHEVGHALNTPEHGWHDQVTQNEKKFKDFLNVIEDARIEKLIKRKFPGLSKSFARAYASLYESDFFGIKKLDDLNKLNLIDRVNLRFKMGAHVVVEFNDFEREIVKEIDAAETWDQVVDIAGRVYDYVKTHEKNKVQNQDDLQDQILEQMRNLQNEEISDDSQGSEDEDEEEEDSYDLGESDESDDESELDEASDGSDSYDPDNSDESDDSDDSDDSDFNSESSGSGGDSDEDDDEDSDEDDDEDSDEDDDEDSDEDDDEDSDEDDDEDSDEDDQNDGPQSVTDRNFRRRERELVNQSGKVLMFDLPDAVLDNIILPNTEVIKDLEKYFRDDATKKAERYRVTSIAYEKLAQESTRKFNASNKKVIMHILKEFEMRKKASEYARTQTARTGELNMNVLHKYRFSNDLFRKIEVVPKGKNHGFIMFVDMSGSMTDILRNTIEQMLVLASFCKLAKVPFDVYGFSNDFYDNEKLREMRRKSSQFVCNPNVDIGLDASSFHLKHLIGSSLSHTQYRRAFNAMCVVAIGSNGYLPKSSGFGLNATPFIETLLASRDIVTKFQRDNKVDVCNVVYLTDGEGRMNLVHPQTTNWSEVLKSVVYLVDKKTKKKIKLPHSGASAYQSAITQLVADVTGCKHIGFYLGDQKYYRENFKHLMYGKSYEESRLAHKSFKENNHFVTSNIGYEKYFYVVLPNTNITDQKLVITGDMTKNKMVREFTKTVNSKKTNRLLLTKLAEELAVS